MRDMSTTQRIGASTSTEHERNVERYLRSIRAAAWVVAGTTIGGIVVALVAWAGTTIPQ